MKLGSETVDACIYYVEVAVDNMSVEESVIGKLLGRLMKEQYGPAMQVFEGLKKQLDPNGIMNPFKLGL